MTLGIDVKVYVQADGDHHPTYIGEGTLEGGTSGIDYRALATLLHQVAWEIEDGFTNPEDLTSNVRRSVRTVVTPIGDVYYEVATDKFIDASSLEEALMFYQEDPSLAVPYDSLISFYPDARTERL